MASGQHHWRLLIALLAGAAPASARDGAYDFTRHGDAVSGVLRLPTEPRGECSQCHDQHASRDGQATAGPFAFALFAPDDNTLCNGCHDTPPPASAYLGNVLYGQSAHALSTAMVWPGPSPLARPSSDWGKCVNCHTPHGARDATGVIPSLLSGREEAPCLACHDGSPAMTDVNTQLAKAFRHPVTTITGKHAVDEGGVPERFGQAQGNRHSECPDCHNPHAAKDSSPPPVAPAARGTQAYVSRVRVSNGTAGAQPMYTWAAANDVSFPNEYEICFKCHSSWTTQPMGQTDFAVALNANNPSFHPVEAAGTNPGVLAASFVAPWTAASTVYCSDCHGSDDPSVPGPHGSLYQYLLKAPFQVGSVSRTTTSSELCFLCHSFDTYANDTAPAAALSASRFNPPQAAGGHALHVATNRVPCYACHVTHGSSTQPFLLVLGRSPGISAFFAQANGGTCTATCHAQKTYTVNYGR